MHSIQRHLLLWILGALSLGAAALIGVSYLVTLEEMDEIFNENLKQVALAVASHHPFDTEPPPQRRDQLPQLPRVYEEDGDFDFTTLTWTNDGRLTFTSDPDVSLPFSRVNGLSEARAAGERWHMYTIVLDAGVVQVAQRESARRTLAGEAASQLLLPLLVLIVLIGVLLTMALRRGLLPFDRAADDIAARSAASLEPIAEAGMPREIHPLIRSINGLMHRLAVAFSAQRRFVADAAHELRSPVTALRLQLQLLERAADDAARLRAVADLKAGIDRSQRLIEQLLSLSRVEPDGPKGSLQPLDLGELTRDAVGRCSIVADDCGVDLGADASDAVSVTADRQQLEVLLDNLIGNAIKYARPGGTVDVRVCRIDGRPALQVIDDGPGIPVAERERVFDRFHRGENTQRDTRHSGSGLGLAIVKAIAQRHDATVALHTAPSGHGLEVRVVFPA
jgi:two-component system, OmpR family, sensor kinase